MRSTRILCMAAAAIALALPAAPAAAEKDKTVEVQILALNDFHGALQEPTGSGGRIGSTPAGGVEYLATHVDRLRAGNPEHTTVVSAGDLVGASPLLSALFHDEPTIEAMNALGLDLNAVGNHEFDEGADELQRLQKGGCHPTDGCQDGDDFEGADFRFLAANVVDAKGRTIFKPYDIDTHKGAKVAYIGMTLEGTPQIVSAAGIRGLEFRDEADTVNDLVPELRKKGAETIVVLLHEGGLPAAGAPDGCPVSGAIVDIVQRTSPEVDLFITGHTHQAYNCIVDGRPVTSAASNGRLVTDIDMTLDRETGEPVEIRRNNVIVSRNVPKAEDQSALIARYAEIAAPIANREVGTAAAAITRAATPAGESALGDVIADAQLAATAPDAFGGARAALMNPGGIRADLDAGPITYGELFSIQPFTNYLVTMTLTGAQLEQVLEQQWTTAGGRILQIAGLTYAWDGSRAPGDRVDMASMQLGGAPVMPATPYRITVNSFLADGGDGFTVLKDGTDRLVGAIDLDAFEAHVVANNPLVPGARDRITRIG